MKPYLQTFFREPVLFIWPAILLPLLVFLGLRVLNPTYTVGATVWVENSNIDASRNGLPQTPSGQEAQALQERLSTVAFREQVLKDADLAKAIESYKWPKSATLGRILSSFPLTKPLGNALGGGSPATTEAAWRRATAAVLAQVKIRDKGHNLLTVTYTGPDKDVGPRLVQAVTKDYIAEKAAARQRKIDESTRLQDPIIAGVQAQVDAARKTYIDALSALPGTATRSQQQAVDDLQRAYQEANDRLQQLKLNQAQATLSIVNDFTGREALLTLVDAPAASPSLVSGLKQTLMLSIVAAILGLGLGGVLIVFRTWMDCTLRGADDVESRLHVPVIGVVPLIRDVGSRRAS